MITGSNFAPNVEVSFLDGCAVTADDPHRDVGDVVSVIRFGDPNDVPIVGDWDSDGNTNVGVVRDGVWYLDTNATNDSGARTAGITFRFGDPGDVPVVGDWNGDGITSPGVFRDGVWFTRNTSTTGIADHTFVYGSPGDVHLFWAS